MDFQPKMALITRTLSNTMVDLAHFFVLFTIVWMGYTIAGYQLFGHLFVDFSNFSRGATALIVILVNWDPSSTIVQVRINLILYTVKFDFQLKIWDIFGAQELHASSEWMYSLFLWSWILLAFYILVFLCWL